MIVIADTGPLIGLAKIRRVMRLERLADAVLIPPLVRRELLGHVGEKLPSLMKPWSTCCA